MEFYFNDNKITPPEKGGKQINFRMKKPARTPITKINLLFHGWKMPGKQFWFVKNDFVLSSNTIENNTFRLEKYTGNTVPLVDDGEVLGAHKEKALINECVVYLEDLITLTTHQ